MNGDGVLLETDAASGIATITLNRPKALNALDMAMADGLRATTKHVAGDATVRAVIIQGAGEHFMAGGDIKAFHETLDAPSAERRALLERLIGEVHEAVTSIRSMEKPVIASVRGAVAGFGFSGSSLYSLIARATSLALTRPSFASEASAAWAIQ